MRGKPPEPRRAAGPERVGVATRPFAAQSGDRLQPLATTSRHDFGAVSVERLPESAAPIQRELMSQGSKKHQQSDIQVAPAATAQAKFVVGKGLNQAGIAAGTTIGKYTFAAVAGAAPGTLGYEKFKNRTWCGGRTYGNADGQLPGGTTYTEWDIHEYAPGARGVERVVVGENGKAYYTPDHYQNFVELRS